MPRTARLLLLTLFSACSFVHTVRLENRSASPATIAYKIRPAEWRYGMFSPRPVIYRKSGKELVPDTTVMMDARDSTIRFTLAPGEEASLARCMNCTYEGFTRPNAVDAWSPDGVRNRLNLSWMRVEHKGTSTTYGPAELLALARKSKATRTVFAITD
ncbi:MAG: hypothetical protein JNM62_10230 [Flavobacteriales bacterium]|nr:hypothetical protein [Flavobacteriales bacterium]